jgi:hydrogenase nickel incorporation protein HypA/HybF
VPEAMQMFFDAFKPDTPLAEARLEVELQGMVAHCAACTKDFELAEPIMFCPECGRPMEMLRGKEILLNAIEVENDDDRR